MPMGDDERFAKVLQFTLIGEASLSSLMTPLLAARFGAPNDQIGRRPESSPGLRAPSTELAMNSVTANSL